ncbi:hypothetical protein FS837_008106 [Tulasnella sp. UAMH 9824]|nr:hypothetical protein FS837_008106 [Tulasnella sp. UAMH 9824]
MTTPTLHAPELANQQDDIDSYLPENTTTSPGSPLRVGETATFANSSLPQRHSTPIHSLPEEIFLEVIRFYLSAETPLRDLTTLTWVCRRWKTVLEAKADFWSQISATEGLEYVRKALQLAKNVPLDLVFSGEGRGMHYESFFKEVGDSIAQWRSLVSEFDGWSMSSPLANLKTTPPPKIVLLRLVNTVFTWNRTVPVTLFGGAPAPPSLKNLHIKLIPIVVTPLQLSRLESLTLQGVQTVFTADIVRILVNSPELRVLHLASLESLDRPNPQATRTGPAFIRLPALCDLLLENVPPSFVHYLLSILDTPNLGTLELTCDDGGQMTSEILTRDTFHLIPVLAAMTMDTQEIFVSLSGYYHYHILAGRLGLGGQMEDPPTNHVRTTVDWMCNHLNNHLRDLPIHLSITDSDPQIDYLDSFSSGLRVSNLALWSDPFYGPRLEELIPPLSQPTLLSPYGWILPRLEVIETNLIWDDGNYDFVDLVRNRYSASTVTREPGPGSEVVVPKRVRELYLSTPQEHPNHYPSPNSAFMQALHEAGKGVDLYWHGAKWIKS